MNLRAPGVSHQPNRGIDPVPKLVADNVVAIEDVADINGMIAPGVIGTAALFNVSILLSVHAEC